MGRFAAKCSGTSPTPWTTQTSATRSKLRVRNSTGCGRTGLSARRAEISSTTLCQSLAALLGATMLLPSWMTGLQNQPQVGSGDVRVLRDELNRSKLRGGAKQSRTSSKLPSSFNAETESKPYVLCISCLFQKSKYTGVTKDQSLTKFIVDLAYFGQFMTLPTACSK